jgi:hypothetical protein
MTAASIWRDATSYAMTADFSVEEAKISCAYVEMIAGRFDREVDEVRHGLRYGTLEGQEAASLARNAD